MNDGSTNYKSRRIQLQLLPLMYFFEIQDIAFAITSLKSPTKTLTLTIISCLVKAIQDQHPKTSTSFQ